MTSRHVHNDEGLGLIELIVSIVVSGIAIAAVATMLVNSWRTQQQVTTLTEATNRGQLVSSTVEKAVRNALYFDVTEGGTVLRVRTSLTGGLKCQVFRITDEGAQFTTDSATLPTLDTGWPSWHSGITKQGTTPYFVRTTAGTVTYTFKIPTEASPVDFVGDIAPRSVQEAGSDGCW